jgi:aryl-alcohol dehydrogenase-like predicted oxidoreductase
MTNDRPGLSRRDALRLGAGAAAALALDPFARLTEPLLAQRAPQRSELITRAIPSSGERLPVIGIGTARRYDVGTTPAERAPLGEVLRRYAALGGKIVDTAPSYGTAEEVVGDLVADLGVREKLFLATKVGVRSGEREVAVRQMEESMRRLRTQRVDLMQIHNLGGVDALLPLLREWKAAGRVRYVGVTTGFDGQHAALEALMRREPLDFIQVNYAIDSREAGERILPLATERGMAVLIALPFGRTSVFQKVQRRALPDWAYEIDCTTWAQLFLKYIVSNPAVTAAIPGTAKPEYLADNIQAAQGRLPDAAMRKRIERFFDAV